MFLINKLHHQETFKPLQRAGSGREMGTLIEAKQKREKCSKMSQNTKHLWERWNILPLRKQSHLVCLNRATEVLLGHQIVKLLLQYLRLSDYLVHVRSNSRSIRLEGQKEFSIEFEFAWRITAHMAFVSWTFLAFLYVECERIYRPAKIHIWGLQVVGQNLGAQVLLWPRTFDGKNELWDLQ